MLLHRSPATVSPSYSRWRLLALIVSTTGLLALLVTGLVLSLFDAIRPGPGTPVATGSADVRPGVSRTPSVLSPDVVRARDQIAASPMPDTGTGHAYGRPRLSTRSPSTPILLPPARKTVGYGVRTGYPQTPAGALAQLAAIDVAALGSTSLAGVRAVIREWAAPGGPSQETWSGIAAMRSLLESTGVATDGSAILRIRATPVMGLIKGTIGRDFVVACVDLTVDVTFGATSRTVAVDCQRMVWDGQRWLIGPGKEPAKAPSVWPGTDAAIDAGYRDLQPSMDAQAGHE